jgi:uncharacterized repeat protein (TIGR01451 family)
MRWIIALIAMLCLFSGQAYANQTPSSTAGTGPVTKTYPGTTTMRTTVAGTRSVIFDDSIALNALGGVTSAQLSPTTMSATTDAIEIDVNPTGCSTATLRCANRGTITLLFNKPVTNPILHLSGLGANFNNATFFHSSLVMTSWTAAAKPTFTVANSNGNLSISGDEIRSTTINGQPSCTTATKAGCGSVRMNGTITSVTFQIDLLMGGSGTATNVDGWNFTVSLDEDFGDAPTSYQATPVASHIVGGLYLGASVTADNIAVTTGAAGLAASPIASATASTDGGDDGVTFPTLIRGIASTIDVAVTGTGGQLQGWIDWAGDGSFATAGDRISTNAIDGGAGDTDGVANGVIRLAVTPPAGATQTTTKARFRISSTASLGINGMAPDGEVEDYEVIVYPQRADLSLTKTVSNPNPSSGASNSYVLRVNSAASTASTATATGVTVQDTLPAGFTFTSATGTGTYNSGTGVWTVGSLAPGAFAEITINGTVTAGNGITVTNIAQISASSLTDPDSTPNNGVTTEDDYASVAFTTPSIINCPTGSTATGSGYTNTGTGTYLNQIYWLDWSCGGTASFPAGSTINKSWTVSDGLVVNAQITNLTAAIRPYVTGSYGGDALPGLYSGLNPIGLIGVTDGQDPQFQIAYTTTLNGQPVSTSYVMSDAESLDGAAESISATTTAANWTLLESSGVVTTNLAGNSFTMSDPAAAGNGTAVVETTGLNPQLNVTINQGGGQAAAFGIFTPFDYSDAPLSGTSYGSTNHRTLPGLRMGAGVTRESAAYDSPTASADVDDAITLPNLFQSQVASVNVPVFGSGYLSAWADWNDDGDFADAGEKYASDAVDGGSGDADATVNGVIVLSVTPPATAATTATIGRFRFASITGAPISGLHGFGEVEDYPLTVILPQLDVTKTSYIVTDYVSESNPKSIPGALVRYCILVTNSGSAPATSVDIIDPLPPEVTYIPGSMQSGASCATATTAEDDNNSGADETDPFGMAITGTTLNATAATLANGASYAMILQAIVN